MIFTTMDVFVRARAQAWACRSRCVPSWTSTRTLRAAARQSPPASSPCARQRSARQPVHAATHPKSRRSCNQYQWIMSCRWCTSDALQSGQRISPERLAPPVSTLGQRWAMIDGPAL